MIVLYFLVFLFPLGVYLLALATINRRERPLMISGTWDALMLSAALSGILLWVGPALLGAFYERGLLPGAAERTDRQFDQIWDLYPWIWITYYALVVCGQALMIVSRRNKTSVYNVDAAALEAIVARVFADKGFRTSLGDGLIVFEKAAEGNGPDNVFSGTGAVDVEVFPSQRHATLHWHLHNSRLRRAIENEVNARLIDAVTAENPSASWLLGASGLIFGFVFLGALFIILTGMRWRGF